MDYIAWNSSFVTNIKVVDEEHYKLVSHLNKLYHAVQAGEGDRIVSEEIDTLSTFADEHFVTEEQLMKEYHYPEYQEHVYRHNEFREELHELKTKPESAKSFMTIELLEFLKQWVSEHFFKEDMKFARYIADLHV